ncbi:hypothetical protein [Uliginosibacterium sediminicola]|uniref:Uncharacterized protein n=1 Tax=Uliginosibacterium sediminicola TaxID=2024550 RepID=A0ABU9YVW7_9RHOO
METTMKAFELDDCGTVYAADSAEDAAMIYIEDTGEQPPEGFPRELSDAELDYPRPEIDEGERPTGRLTTLRAWLAETKTKGLLACEY